MKHINLRIALVALSILLIGVLAGYWWAQHRAAPEQPAKAEQAGRRVLYWHDPMVPNARFDKPGKSPFMNMDLVPVYADEEGGAAVRVSSTVAQNLGIRLARVEKAMLSPKLEAVGSIAYDERLVEVVQPRSDGYVTRLHVKAPLERVSKGQPLVEIVAPAWLQAQEEYIALLDAQSGRGQSVREAGRQRLTVLGVPEATIRDVEAQRKTNASTTIVAPSDGVITELSVREGAAFSQGAALFRINGLRTVWLDAKVPEAQISMIPVGSTASARTPAWPGITFRGRVSGLLPNVDPQTRTLPVRVVIENPESKLVPGMFVSVTFEGKADEHLAVPSESVIVTGERTVVVVAREGGGFDVVPVTVGMEVEGKTAILSGLSEGQSVVVSGQFLIDSEASLRSTVSRLSTEASSQDQKPAAAGEPPNARASHLAEGTITAITPDAITISHGPVPSLQWNAMTMSFKPPPQGMPAELKVGDRVSFSFAPKEQGEFQIESLTILGHASAEPKP